tara:strand:+ start:214 stop:975 length:762 start_codon:yes stop_codon:yes gene_type:complete
MEYKKRLIFKINKLKKDYKSNNILKINKLDIHPGTIYGIIGTVGSGKSTLLNILAGFEKQTSGTILYDNKVFKKNWMGKIIPEENIFYSKDPIINGRRRTVSSYVSNYFKKKKNIIENRYFNKISTKNMWNRNISDISAGELNWLGMILACEVDPRVLLIDDYGMYFNNSMEKDFRSQIIKMNRRLGTTIILTAPSELYLKHFASVMIFLDQGHISKIRTGNLKTINRKQIRNKNHRRSNNRSRKKHHARKQD